MTKDLSTIPHEIEAIFKKSELPKEHWPMIPMAKLAKRPYKPITFLVEHLIPEHNVVLLTGNSTVGKTWIALSIGLTVAAGTPLFGQFNTQKTGVWYIDKENGENEMIRRLLRLQGPAEIWQNLPFTLTNADDISFTPETVVPLIQQAKHNNIGLIIFDSFSSFNDDDENKTTEMRQLMDMFKLIRNSGISVIILHHNRKGGTYGGPSTDKIRGASSIYNSVDAHIEVQKIKDKEDHIKITQTKLRCTREFKPFEVSFNENTHSNNRIDLQFQGLAQPKSEKKKKRDIVTEGILDILAQEPVELPIQALLDKLQEVDIECTKTTLKKYLQAMTGKQISTREDGKKKYFSLLPAEQIET
ncbi:MAG: AAA family ATPase [Patescibacteria group bacterium]|jgi:RecA-family ATPase